MAEIFAAASAGIGIAAAAGQVIDSITKLTAFCKELRDLPTDIQNATEDLSTLVQVLELVRLHINQQTPASPLTVAVSSKILMSLQQGSRLINQVLKEMKSRYTKHYFGRIRAVGMKKSLGKAMLRLHTAQTLLLLTMATENRCVMSAIPTNKSNKNQSSSLPKSRHAKARIYNDNHTDYRDST